MRISFENFAKCVYRKYSNIKFDYISFYRTSTSQSSDASSSVSQSGDASSSVSQSGDASSSVSQSISQRATLNSYLLHDEVTKAEIQWCIFSITNNLSNRTAAAAIDLLKIMFPSEINLKLMQLGRDKISYTNVFGIAPFFKSILTESISKSPVFVIGFDESINKISQRGQMDVHIRLWMDDKVVTRFYTSEFLGHATAQDLVNALTSATSSLDTSKLLQISMDGPNVNQAALRLVKEARVHDTKLIDIGSCSLHVIDGALRAADKGFAIMNFLRSSYEVFKDLPSRRADYIYFADNKDAKLPLKYCSTRWVENVSVAERIVEIIPYLQSYVAGMANKRNEPDSKSYNTMKTMLKDPLLKAKVCFFISVAKELEKFLKEFQDDKPMLPFLFEAIESMIDTLMKRFVKPDILDANQYVTQRIKLSLAETNLLEPKYVDVGYAAKKVLKSIKSATISDSSKLIFQSECRSLLVRLVEKLQARCPLKYPLVQGCASLDPGIMLASDNSKVKLLDKALTGLVELNWLSGTEADQAKSQYQSLCSQRSAQETLKTFKRSDRLDAFLMNLFQNEKSPPELIKFMKIVFCLSHGQASIERGFSINKSLLVENQKERSLIAQRVIHDHIRSVCDGQIPTEIPKKLILSARNAAARYKEAKREQQLMQTAENQALIERKRKALEVKEKENECKRLKMQIQLIEEDISKLKK